MKRLVIRNVGPIKCVDVNLRRFNYFIGPQSSGKSTIAKILSTCEWIEKEVAITFDENVIANGQDFKELFEGFHKMEGYFDARESSYVHYETDCITIDYINQNVKITLKQEGNYYRQKICYIPAERNMVTLPELSGFEFGMNNLRSFLFDWYSAREFYNNDNKTDLLGLGVQYYYDKNILNRQDRIQHSNGESYDVSLSNSSSGLQSLTPLIVMLQYYSGQYFTEFNRKYSFSQDSKTKKMYQHLSREIVFRQYRPDYTSDELPSIAKEIESALKKGDSRVMRIFDEYDEACNRLLMPNRTTFIIEEPEQNLFPFTQVELLETIVKLCSNSRKHGYTITTHSPFILNYLNVLIMRYYNDVPEKASINPDELTVFSTQDGRLIDLVQTNAKTLRKSVNSEDLVEAMRDMYNEYMSLK